MWVVSDCSKLWGVLLCTGEYVCWPCRVTDVARWTGGRASECVKVDGGCFLSLFSLDFLVETAEPRGVGWLRSHPVHARWSELHT